jgi:hypothetical protein
VSIINTICNCPLPTKFSFLLLYSQLLAYLPPTGNNSSISCPYNLAFCRLTQIEFYNMAFWVWLLSVAKRVSILCMQLSDSIVSSLNWLYVDRYLLFYQLKYIWVVSSSRWLWIVLYKKSYVGCSLCVNLFSSLYLSVLEIEVRVSFLLGKCVTSCVISPSPSSFEFVFQTGLMLALTLSRLALNHDPSTSAS